MNNNVNVLSVNASSSKNLAQTAAKAGTKSVNTGQENFSQTLDQAQQARNKGDVRKETAGTDSSKASDAAANDKTLDAKSKSVQSDTKSQVASDGKKAQNESSGQAKAGNKAEFQDNGENIPDAQEAEPNSQAAVLLAAEAQASLVQNMPMAELNTYFKGDARLQGVQTGVQEQLVAAGAEAVTGMLQQSDQQMGNPLDSLQPVQVLEQVQRIENVENAAESVAGGIENLGQTQQENDVLLADVSSLRQVSVDNEAVQSQAAEVDNEAVQLQAAEYVPGDIAALLGSKQLAKADNSGTISVVQSQQDTNQQMLNLLAGQQGAYTPQTAARTTQEAGVSVNKLASLTNGLETSSSEAQLSQNLPVIDDFQQSMSNAQEQFANGQGQQQGSQLPGEASFDVVVPDQQESGLTKMYHPLEQHGLSFQQMMDNQAAVQQTDGDAGQASQLRETYNVPQQIVEQAKLLQRGTDSEMIIKLNPEHLGQLSLKVSVNGNGGVTATFHTDNAQVRAILETTMTQLKQQLDEQGIKVDNVEVQTGLPDGQLPQDQGQQGFYSQQQGQQLRSQQADINDFEEASQKLAVEAETSEESQEVLLDSQGNQISRGVDYSV